MGGYRAMTWIIFLIISFALLRSFDAYNAEGFCDIGLARKSFC